MNAESVKARLYPQVIIIRRNSPTLHECAGSV